MAYGGGQNCDPPSSSSSSSSSHCITGVDVPKLPFQGFESSSTREGVIGLNDGKDRGVNSKSNDSEAT